MNHYPHLPENQHGVQRRVDHFNSDESFWRSLERRLKVVQKTLAPTQKKTTS